MRGAGAASALTLVVAARAVVESCPSAHHSDVRRLAVVVVGVIAVGSGCGSGGGAQPDSATAGRHDFATPPIASTTTAAPAATEVATTSTANPTTTTVSPATIDRTIVRPAPIREGGRVTAVFEAVDGVVLADSSVTLRLVEFPDGRFLEADMTNAVVPAGAAYWTTEINGKLRSKTTARQGSTHGTRVDRDIYASSFAVRLSATTTNGRVLATTGDVQLAE
jgi:hypothetical protein